MRRSLALGIDLGRSRVRVVGLEMQRTGGPVVVAASAADVVDGDRAVALHAALSEIRPRARDCVLGLASATPLRSLSLPKLSRSEFQRVCAFEAAAMLDPLIGPTRVRAVRDRGRTLVTAAAKSSVDALVAIALRAGARPMHVDHSALALERLGEPAILDIAGDCASIVIAHEGGFIVRSLQIGGDSFTRALADAYSIDVSEAESRKRQIGMCGVGTTEIEHFAQSVEAAMTDVRTEFGNVCDSLALVGNGSRIAELPKVLQRRCGLRIERPSFARLFETQNLPALEASAADWYTAVALATYDLETGRAA